MRRKDLNMSVDCVIYGYDMKKLNIIVLERILHSRDTGELLIDDLKLPGNQIYQDEDFDEGAARIVKDLTGLDNIELHQFKAFGSPARISGENDLLWFRHIKHPHTRVFTVAYYSLLKPYQTQFPLKRKEHARWYPIYEVGKMAYDHKQIVQQSLEALRVKIRLQPNLIFQLLPPKFTISQLMALYEQLYEIKLDRRNFYKKINSLKYIVRLNEQQENVGHKPGVLYMFNQDLFEQYMNKRVII
jgi:8-oxo-dGTP diphosphatase